MNMNMSNISNTGKILGAVGALGGVWYAMRKHQKLPMTLVYAVGLGLVGVLVGNQVSKMHSTTTTPTA